jgi:hypothetical protein
MRCQQFANRFTKIAHFVKAAEAMTPNPTPNLPRTKFRQTKRHHLRLKIGKRQPKKIGFLQRRIHGDGRRLIRRS